MTRKLFNELYDKYQPWFNRPVEVLTASSKLGERNYKKFLLMDIEGALKMEQGGQEDVSEPFVTIQDLVTLQVQTIPLQDFNQEVRFIDLSEATTLELSKSNKTGNITIDNSLCHIEFFIIQIRSHFGKKPIEWAKVASNLVLNFNLKRTKHNPTSIPDKLFISSLITNQIQPVFNISRTYPIGELSYGSETGYFDIVEITIEELNPINEDYEMTFVFEKQP